MIRLSFIIAFLINCVLASFSQSTYYNSAKQYAEKGDYDEAIRLTKQSLEKDAINPDKFDLLLDYENLCDYYSNKMEPDSCRHYAIQALNIINAVDDIDHITILQLLSLHLLNAKCYDEALNCREQILDIILNRYGSSSPQLVSEYSMLSWFYQNAGNNILAVEYAKKEEELAYQTRNIIEDFPNRRTYMESLSSLMRVIQLCDEPIAGISYLLKVLGEHSDAIDKDSQIHILNSIWAISRDNNFLDGCLAVYKHYTLYGTYKEKLTNLININVEDISIKNDIHAREYAQSLYDLAIRNELTQWFSIILPDFQTGTIMAV